MGYPEKLPGLHHNSFAYVNVMFDFLTLNSRGSSGLQ